MDEKRDFSRHIPPGEKENHLQNAIFGGYVSSLEGSRFADPNDQTNDPNDPIVDLLPGLPGLLYHSQVSILRQSPSGISEIWKTPSVHFILSNTFGEKKLWLHHLIVCYSKNGQINLQLSPSDSSKNQAVNSNDRFLWRVHPGSRIFQIPPPKTQTSQANIQYQ